MNIAEIARRANVSTATVSRTLNQSGPVKAATARKVWRAVTALNYYPNSHARTLVSGRSRLIGLIVSDITNPSFIRSAGRLVIEDGVELQGLSKNGIVFGSRVSIGAATAMAGPDNNASQLVATADAALYRAKHLGRNRISLPLSEAA